MTRSRTFLALAVGAGFVFAACSGSPAAQAPAEATDVRLQLQWAPQAQFAGYFAAAGEGYYEDEGLNVTFVPGGPDSHPAGRRLRHGRSRVHDLLGAQGARGQAWHRAVGPRQHRPDLPALRHASVSWKDSNITGPADFAGKKVGVWDFGNEYEVTAAASKAGLEVGTDYEKVIQDFNMALLLTREIDVAEAMIYNEYAQVLETTNPDTGELYQPEDLNVIDYNDVGTAMLQDAIWAREAWLAEEGNEDIATRFLARRSRAGSSAATTPTSASSTPSTRVRRSAPATRRG